MSCAPIPNTSRPKPLRPRKVAQASRYIDEPVTQIRKWSTSTDTSYYLQGNNYNVEALTDRTGSVVERYEYSPYGKPTVYTGAGTDGKWFTSDDVSATVSAKGNALTFQGRELDGETGNYAFRNRYFHPILGLFISRDPLRKDGDLSNIHRFVMNNPSVYMDPYGLKCIVISREAFGMPDKIRQLSRKWIGFDIRTFKSREIQIQANKTDPNTPGYSPTSSVAIAGYCVEAKVGEYIQIKWLMKVHVKVTRKCCEGCDATVNCSKFQTNEDVLTEETELLESFFPVPIDAQTLTSLFGGFSKCRNSQDLPSGPIPFR